MTLCSSARSPDQWVRVALLNPIVRPGERAPAREENASTLHPAAARREHLADEAVGGRKLGTKTTTIIGHMGRSAI